jgi:hypothetical protein
MHWTPAYLLGQHVGLLAVQLVRGMVVIVVIHADLCAQHQLTGRTAFILGNSVLNGCRISVILV